ncbi:hypothetical protein FHS18_005110 [Paenibacillus phyllosphaerae]|uniref:Uncharacterized protein n=1 Tax=Paenibacillus phyllosphaerae TaxID=274593 RepID=A0A7W5FQ75_9BACL|nr:hypothetical protein [Paenibacillus phyllosphaerae]MBB3113008.1 hypothetical protein [Paenibacillus phyllosphaerae]
MPNVTVLNETRAKWTFISGQEVAYDGVYTNVWGGRLPLVRGDRFPMHPEMGACRWTYSGPLGERLEELSGSVKRRDSY